MDETDKRIAEIEAELREELAKIDKEMKELAEEVKSQPRPEWERRVYDE